MSQTRHRTPSPPGGRPRPVAVRRGIPRTFLVSAICRLASIPYPDAREGGQRSSIANDHPRHAMNIAFDIVAFGQRDRFAQSYVRQDMYRILKASFARSGIAWPAPPLGWAEDRGDGVLIVLTSAIPAPHDIDLLMLYLAAELRRHNRAASPDTQIRLRMALNTGQVFPDPDGLGGKVIVTLFRMLDAPDFKETVADTGTTLGVIMSEDFYNDEIEPGWGILDPGTYHPLPILNKETNAYAWCSTTF